MQGVTVWSANANSSNVALFCFAKFVTGDTADLAGAGAVTVGVFTEVAGSGNPCSVQLDGVGKITLATTLNAGVQVASDASGHATTYSSGWSAGVLLKGGSAGDIVPIKLSA
jgi:hypothetical protein